MEITNYNKEQVFISFRGDDVRNGLLCYLKQKLVDGNVNVFTDENVIGQKLENSFEHIRNSKIAIVIFSESYADSDWCLKELDQINKCIETKELKAVIPIFYKVKVSRVKKQTGKFGEKFRALQNSLLAEKVNEKEIEDINSMIKEWKKALNDVTGMGGLTYRNNITEMAFVENVVEKVKINLANIAAEEGRISTPETSKISPGRQSNPIIYNFNQCNINILLHRSKNLEVLGLMSYNPEGHNKSNDLKPSSPTIRRIASDLDHRDQYGPFPFEALMVPKQNENQRSIDNPKKIRDDAGQKMIQGNSGNEPSVARN